MDKQDLYARAHNWLNHVGWTKGTYYRDDMGDPIDSLQCDSDGPEHWLPREGCVPASACMSGAIFLHAKSPTQAHEALVRLQDHLIETDRLSAEWYEQTPTDAIATFNDDDQVGLDDVLKVLEEVS